MSILLRRWIALLPPGGFSASSGVRAWMKSIGLRYSEARDEKTYSIFERVGGVDENLRLVNLLLSSETQIVERTNGILYEKADHNESNESEGEEKSNEEKADDKEEDKEKKDKKKNDDNDDNDDDNRGGGLLIPVLETLKKLLRPSKSPVNPV
eukprot:TRINITY_DN1035_c0_g1_i2.p1 TRINITY_DN1035_c0_g1~~TRINITY_DN1035_c0_g1_i2.p1  ORF type:complete len:153 (+),score=42.99 TRINITY_DN1035_c0_g1_i2:141-599(+)